MKIIHQALVSVRIYSSEDQNIITKVIKELNNKSDVLKASSVYRVKTKINETRNVHALRSEGRFSGLCVVVKLQTSLAANHFLIFLQNLERQLQGEVLKRTVSLNLLTYDDYTCMTPWLTLPHPDFHRRPEEVILAAEIWGEYVHPVLKKNLKSITLAFDREDWGEFFAQGKSVLDF